MSDLLHFQSSHDLHVFALTSLLAESSEACVHVASGNYTAPHGCDRFLKLGAHAGLIAYKHLWSIPRLYVFRALDGSRSVSFRVSLRFDRSISSIKLKVRLEQATSRLQY